MMRFPWLSSEILAFHLFGVFLFIGGYWLGRRKEFRWPYLLAIGTSILVSVIFVLTFGWLGHTWSIASVVGKFIAAVFGISLPVIASAITIRSLHNRGPRIFYPAAALIGLVMSLFAPLLWLFAVTILTGDAL